MCRLAGLPKTDLFMCQVEKRCPNTCLSSSAGLNNTTALTQSRRQGNENNPNRLPMDCVWAVAESFHGQGQPVSSERCVNMVPCIVQRDATHIKIPRIVLINIRTTEVAMRIPGRPYCIDCGTYIDSVPLEIYDELVKTRPRSLAFSACEEALTNRVLLNTTLT